MKRFLFIIACLLISTSVFGQEENSRSKQDSLILSKLDLVLSRFPRNPIPRYKLYKTQNIYTLIELDTATGALWQVQYGMNNSSSKMKVALDDSSLLFSWETPYPGRFELYPTENVYTFILVDQVEGYTYQVQWSTNPQQRFRSYISRY